MWNNAIPDFRLEKETSLHTVELTTWWVIIIDFREVATYMKSRGKYGIKFDWFLDIFATPYLEQIEKTRKDLNEQIKRLKQDLRLYVKKSNQKSLCSNLDRHTIELDAISDGDILAGFIPQDINKKLWKYWIEYWNPGDSLPRELRRKVPKQQNGLLFPPRAIFMKLSLNYYEQEMNKFKTMQVLKEQQKLSPTIKKSKTKNSAPKISSVNDTIDTSQQVARSTEEKLGRIQVRVDNILWKTITQQSIDELQMIKANITQLTIDLDTPIWNIAQNISELIAEVLSAGIQDELDINISDKNTVLSTNGTPWELNTLTQNNEFISYIRAIRSTIITYNISSKQWGESIGDGNFIAHVWRPFLSMVEHLLQANRIDANSFAWQDVSQEIQSSHDGFTKRVRLKMFMDILSTMSDVSDWKNNWENIVQSVQQFAQTASYTRSNWVTPLKNFLWVLIENPPPSW